MGRVCGTPHTVLCRDSKKTRRKDRTAISGSTATHRVGCGHMFREEGLRPTPTLVERSHTSESITLDHTRWKHIKGRNLERATLAEKAAVGRWAMTAMLKKTTGPDHLERKRAQAVGGFKVRGTQNAVPVPPKCHTAEEQHQLRKGGNEAETPRPQEVKTSGPRS